MNNAIFIILNKYHFNYTIAFLNSLSKNWSDYPTIICNYSNDLNEEQLNILKSYDRLKLFSLNLEENEFGRIPSHKSIGMIISYGKLRIWSPDLSHIYGEYDNILYIDVDTLVLKPLDELINMNEFTIFRSEYSLDFQYTPKILSSLLEEDNILEYFDNNFIYTGITSNSGVMIIPKKVRTKDNYNYLMYLLNRYKDYNRLADQAIINLWMIKNKYIPNISTVKYNFLTFYLNKDSSYWRSINIKFDDGIIEEFNKIHIVHFAIKPDILMNTPYILNHNLSYKYAQELYNIYHWLIK